MPPLLQRLRSRFPRTVLIWAAVTLLLALGVLISIFHLAGVPARETLRANSEQQRVIVDPVTGMVSGLSAGNAASAPFEVADEEEPATEEPTAAGEEPVSTPAAEEEITETSSAEPASTLTDLEPLVRERPESSIPIVARTRESLVTAPAPEISEKVEEEMLPMRGKNEARPATLYARSFTRREGQKLVAIVVTDVGFSDDVLKQLIALPGEITAGFSPYAQTPARQIEALRNDGHEVWAMLPMMSARYPQDDPGPLGLIDALTIKGAMTRLHTVLADTIGSVGVILPPDETFSQNTDLWNAVRDEIDARGLSILSTSKTQGAKELGAVKQQADIVRRADLLLDSTPSAAFIRSKLAGIKELSAAQPELVVLVSARPQALKLLGEWLATNPLGEEALLVPLSAIYAPITAPVEAAPPKEESSHGGGGH